MTVFTPQVNELRSLDYRINLMMEQGRFAEARRFIDQLLPLYDWLGGQGANPQRVVGRDRQHYVVLAQQCQLGAATASADAAAWTQEIRGHLQQARSVMGSDIRTAHRAHDRAREMVEKKQASPDVKAPLVSDLDALKAELRQAAEDLGLRARTTLLTDRPRACAEYEAAIEVLKAVGAPVQAKTFEEELGTAVYAQQTGSRIDEIRNAIKSASRAEDVDRLNAEMDRIRRELQSAHGASVATAAAQAGQLNAVLGQILREVEETKNIAAHQKQVIVAQNVHIGDQITVKDSVVQDSDIGGGRGGPAGGGPGGGAVIQAQNVSMGNQINVQDSVVQNASVASAGGPPPTVPGVISPTVPQGLATAGGPPRPGAGSAPGAAPGALQVCPYCGRELRFPKPPVFCPFCRERLQ